MIDDDDGSLSLCQLSGTSLTSLQLGLGGSFDCESIVLFLRSMIDLMSTVIS